MHITNNNNGCLINSNLAYLLTEAQQAKFDYRKEKRLEDI